jgi:acyl carrier protein
MLMPQEETVHAIADIVERLAHVPANQVTPGTDFADDLGIDSLTMVEVVVGIEDRFGVRIVDDDVAGLRTVADAAEYIERVRVGA